MPTCVTPQWHIDVPGTRWFRADLHVHTLDDHPCSEFKWPAGLCGEPNNEEVQSLYAKKFLKNAIEKQIEVIGLTPHAIRSSQTSDSSATWAIVDKWLTGVDDDGIAFKDKIYAIFPGFEPSLYNGAAGLHLLFLFDPSIGKQAYFDAYSEVMGAVPAWQGNSLNMSNKSAWDAFNSLHTLQLRLKPDWNYICLAAHAFGEKGLFKLQSQVLGAFPHQYISGLQLGNSMIPERAYMNKPWLKDSMKEYHQGFFHSSDSYSFDDIGSFFSMFKLASPTIESLRQAFLANDSRIKICYIKQDENMVLDSNLPQPSPWNRQWLKSIKITGGCSFFNSEIDPQKPAYEEFDFSPDLTCIIGGRMSGKSTLLDGIRYEFEHELPRNKQLQKDVVDRAKTKFLSGNPSLEIEIKGPENETLPLKDRWCARFYTQREIQQIANDQSSLKNIIYSFNDNSHCDLSDAENELLSLNTDIELLANKLLTARERLLQAESIFLTAKKSKEALSKFHDAGIDDLENLQKDASKIKQNTTKIVEAIAAISSLPQNIESIAPGDMLHTLSKDLLDENKLGNDLIYKTKKYKIARRYMICIVNSLLKDLSSLSAGFDMLLSKTKSNIIEKLVELGEAPELINQFDKLTRDSKDYEIAEKNLLEAKIKYLHDLRDFVKKIKIRRNLLGAKGALLSTNIESISEIFNDSIKVSIIQNGCNEKLNDWVQSLKDQGITRWWNSCREKKHNVSPQELYHNFKHNKLDLCGMSNIVSGKFISKINFENKIKLLSIYSEDTFVVELLVDQANNDYKPLQELSGGAQISVLLSLILESGDSTPLVIDQPEDEIDKAYLFDVLIPSLRRLKGKRQIIFSTHDPNIVVNADADLVIYLEANSKKSCVKSRGAIEEVGIKNAIIKILDGGEEAFKLRKQKYGF